MYPSSLAICSARMVVKIFWETYDDTGAHQLVRQSYAWEQLVTSYIEDGRPETLRELFSAPPRARRIGRTGGKTDPVPLGAPGAAPPAGRSRSSSPGSAAGLRQVRNMGVCTAALSSRAAIRGGLDPQDAFLVSDLYIQKRTYRVRGIPVSCLNRVQR